MALEPAVDRENSRRGLTSYFCYKTGHDWLECPCLHNLSAAENEDIANHRRVYFEKRRNKLKSLWDKPGLDFEHVQVRPTNSWKKLSIYYTVENTLKAEKSQRLPELTELEETSVNGSSNDGAADDKPFVCVMGGAI